jgi:hypothetical protein
LNVIDFIDDQTEPAAVGIQDNDVNDLYPSGLRGIACPVFDPECIVQPHEGQEIPS